MNQEYLEREFYNLPHEIEMIFYRMVDCFNNHQYDHDRLVFVNKLDEFSKDLIKYQEDDIEVGMRKYGK